MLRDPVFTFPFEITSEIFIHCLPTSYTDREWNTANPCEAPMLLLHVCRSWRERAIGTPALWAKMELSMDTAHSHDMAQVCLMRAKSCPLSVKLRRWPSKAAEEDSWPILFFQTLLGRASTLEVLEVLPIPLYYIRRLDQLPDSSDFPSLQKLAVGVRVDVLRGEPMDERPCVRLFANAPLLRGVTFIGDISPTFFPALPWQQVTKYTGVCVPIDYFLDALRISRNLVECVWVAGMFDLPFVEHLNHSSLKSLSLEKNYCFLDSFSSTYILRFLTLSSLETLRILDCEYNAFSDRRFLAFLTRSSPPLRQFIVKLDTDIDLDADEEELGVDAFLSMSSLVELEIWHPIPKFLTIFFSHLNNVTFLPQLRHLSIFHLRHRSEASVRSLLKTVHAHLSARWDARHHGPGQLESFYFEWDRDVGDLPGDDLAPFRAMASDGLNISIKSPKRSYV
ncbi:F-box domain-containing protein [Mycena sanguinolenta]|uniref:F-box domain-containing protein n=1 Tax=Mycena sanguinolenta TaxID=230812 RepID=A0A8H7CRZ1_9AGAR|nr:F-box domain-containing protein [Mycena sanguinolenta]